MEWTIIEALNHNSIRVVKVFIVVVKAFIVVIARALLFLLLCHFLPLLFGYFYDYCCRCLVALLLQQGSQRICSFSEALLKLQKHINTPISVVHAP